MKNFLINTIKLYQKIISPRFPNRCRFYPTCSNYALQAIEKHGPTKGLMLAIWRILRCNPFSKGGFDYLK